MDGHATTSNTPGIDDLVLDAPPEIADDLQFSGDDLKEKVREDEKDAAGKPTGRTALARPAPAARNSAATTSEDQFGAGAAAARRRARPATVDWPELQDTLGLFHETGTVAVVKDGNLEITRATPTGLELIDPAELPDFARDPARRRTPPRPGTATGRTFSWPTATRRIRRRCGWSSPRTSSCRCPQPS